MKFEEIIERIKSYIEKKENNNHVYDKDIGKYLGINPVTLSRLKKQNSVPFEKIINFCNKENLSLDWILLGKNDTESKKTLKINYKFNEFLYNKKNYLKKQNSYILIDKKFLTILGIEQKEIEYIEAFNAIDDSMSPIIEKKSIVYIDKRLNHISNNEIYAFFVKNLKTILIRRLILNPFKNKVVLVSENKYYDKISLNLDEIKIEGKVIAVTNQI